MIIKSISFLFSITVYSQVKLCDFIITLSKKNYEMFSVKSNQSERFNLTSHKHRTLAKKISFYNIVYIYIGCIYTLLCVLFS